MYDINTQLLCTFTKEKNIIDRINEIKENYDIIFNKLFVLQNKDKEDEFMLTYNIDSKTKIVPNIHNTISVHRKKYTNTLYTINALNYLIEVLNGGLDKTYQVNWDNYKNMLIIIADDEIKKIPTKLIKIINT